MKIKLFAIITLFMSMSLYAQQRAALVSVSDAAGNPLAGVTVEFEVTQYPADKKSVTTDSKGRAGFRDFKPGDVVITFKMEGFLERQVQFRTSEDKIREKFDVTMYRQGDAGATDENSVDVTGKVFDSAGSPLAGVKVVCSVEGTPFRSENVTDADGTYSLRGFINNENQLYGSLKGYRDQIVKVRVQSTPVDLTAPTHFIMKTIQEAYAEMGKEVPKDEAPTPEEEAADLYNLAVEPYQQGSYDQAEEMAKRALEKNPTQVNSLKLLVHCNYKLEDWKEALTYAEAYLQTNPADVNILKIAAQAAENTKQKDKLKGFNAKLKGLGEESPVDPWGDAVDAINAKNDEKLGKILKEIIANDPKDARAYLEMAKIKVREYEFDEAKTLAQTCMKYASKNSEYFNEAKELILTLSD